MVAAITVDDDWAVLEDFPGGFEQDGEGERVHTVDGKEQPEQQIEQEAVNDVRESVPIREMLGVLQSSRHACQNFHIAAFADPDVAQHAQDKSLCGDQQSGHERRPSSPDPSGRDHPIPAVEPLFPLRVESLLGQEHTLLWI